MKLPALYLSALFVLFSLQATAFAGDAYSYSGFSTGLGVGVLFFEADEEFNSSLIIEAKAGYDLNESFTLEASFGYLPYMDSRSGTSENPNTWHLDTSSGLRTAVDLIYHLDDDPARKWDPTIGATGGLMYFANSLENNQHYNAFGGLGAGLGYALTRRWVARADYRLVVAGHDTELNHHTLISFNYRWGAGGGASGTGDAGYTDGGSAAAASLKTVYFEFDKSTLTVQSKEKLRENAAFLKENPDAKVLLEGNCDERGTNEYNTALGQKRAYSAYEFLRALGVAEDRMETVSYGEERPADPAHTEAAWAKNRRVECLVR